MDVIFLDSIPSFSKTNEMFIILQYNQCKCRFIHLMGDANKTDGFFNSNKTSFNMADDFFVAYSCLGCGFNSSSDESMVRQWRFENVCVRGS